MSASDQFRGTPGRLAFIVMEVNEGKIRTALKFFKLIGWREVKQTILPDARFVAPAQHGFVPLALRVDRDNWWGHPSDIDVVGISVGDFKAAFEAIVSWAKPRRIKLQNVKKKKNSITFSVEDVFTAQIMFVK